MNGVKLVTERRGVSSGNKPIVPNPGVRPTMHPVLIKGFALVASRKRLFMLGMVVVAASMGVLTQLGPWGVWTATLAVTVTLFLLMLRLSQLAAARYHPALLFVRAEPPSFASPVNLAPVFTAAAFVILCGGIVAENVGDIVNGDELWLMDAATAGLGMLAVAVHLYVALGSFGVRLYPEGIHDRQPFGSLFVPWEALAVPRAALPRDTQQVILYLAHPELVRKRGLRGGDPHLLSAAGINAEFLARAIHEYANRADLRPAIGSEAALAQFQAIPQVADLTNGA
ncbi:hypothetical protein SAMN06264365_1521 [Actinoplanes regularis]|uniref:PH domain-containing protein n=1 Tax=Actinoplanes regularis TaxID=52697 RepID=A0A239KKE7_9ACTN|nr:hypothetical protein SAMN06264365_1521 [Actinoplanes regularis]